MSSVTTKRIPRGGRLAGAAAAALVMAAVLGSGSVAAAVTLGAAPVSEAKQQLAPVATAPGRDLYRVTYVGGEPAEVEISSRESLSLVLLVFDDDRRLICRSAEAGPVQRCVWHPSATAPFWIEVRNPAGQDVAYQIETN
jgi:hypothetical protein